MEIIKDIVAMVDVRKDLIDRTSVMDRAREKGIESMLVEFVEFYDSYEGDKSKLTKRIYIKDTESKDDSRIGFCIGLRIYVKS